MASNSFPIKIITLIFLTNVIYVASLRNTLQYLDILWRPTLFRKAYSDRVQLIDRPRRNQFISSFYVTNKKRHSKELTLNQNPRIKVVKKPRPDGVTLKTTRLMQKLSTKSIFLQRLPDNLIQQKATTKSGFEKHRPNSVTSQNGFVKQRPNSVPSQSGYVKHRPDSVTSQSGFVRQHPNSVTSQNGFVKHRLNSVVSQNGFVKHHPNSVTSQNGFVKHHPNSVTSQNGFEKQRPDSDTSKSGFGKRPDSLMSQVKMILQGTKTTVFTEKLTTKQPKKKVLKP